MHQQLKQQVLRHYWLARKIHASSIHGLGHQEDDQAAVSDPSRQLWKQAPTQLLKRQVLVRFDQTADVPCQKNGLELAEKNRETDQVSQHVLAHPKAE